MEFQLSLEDLCAAVGLRKLDIPILVDVYTTECSSDEIQDKHGITAKMLKTMKEKFSRMCAIIGVEKKDGVKLISGIKLELKPRTQMLQHKIKSLEALNKKLDKALIEKTVYVDDIVNDIMSEIDNVQPVPYKCEHKFSTTPEYSILNLSDWHIGSKWTEKETGFGAMNNDELERRVQRLTEKTVRIVNMQRTTRNIDTLVINALGDFIENEVIFGSQGTNIQECAASQMATCAQLMEKMLITFSGEFKNILFYGVSGNHSRMSRAKGDQHFLNSWDRLMYLFLAERFKNVENIKFHIAETPMLGYVLEDAPRYSHLIMHGDGINSTGGVPWAGVEKTTSKLSDMFERTINYQYIGHFHRDAAISRQPGKLFVNGCLTGTSPGAVSWLLSGKPSQTLLGFHPQLGVTYNYEIFVADMLPPVEDNNGVFTPYCTGLFEG